MNHTLETHLLRSSDVSLLRKEAERVNNFLNLNSEKYEFPCVKDGKMHEWKIEAEVVGENSGTLICSEEHPDFLIVKRKTDISWRDYIPEEHKKEWEKDYSHQDNFTMSRNMALLIPDKNLAIDLREPLMNKHSSIKTSLKYAGYNILKKVYNLENNMPKLLRVSPFLNFDPFYEESFFPWWNIQFSDRDMHYLMRRRKSIPSFDRRAYEIIDELTKGILEASGLSLKDITYQFVTHALTLKKERDEYYNQKEEIEMGIMKVLDVPAEKVINGGIEKIQFYLPPSYALGIRSIIKTPEGLRHIPMIDFYDDLRLSEDHFRIGLKNELRDKGYLPGMFVDSGRSIHFYGFKLLEEEKWKDFMDEMKKLYFSDKNFVDIQKESGSTILRITPANVKLYQPKFYQKINYDI